MTAAIYLRVSTAEQRQRETIATQREITRAFCERQGIEVVEVYEDDGVSGTIPLDQRPAGARLLRDARDRRFTEVVLYRLDRLGRDTVSVLTAIDTLTDGLGINVRSTAEILDLESPDGILHATMVCGFSTFERSVILQRSIDGTNRLAREGAYLGGIVPYGYQVVGKDREARLVIADDPLPDHDLSEADVIRLIYRLTVEERKTCCQIAAHLTRLGIPPRYVIDGRLVQKGKRKEHTAGGWSASRIRNMLKNPTYKGVYQYGKRSKKAREIIERHVPALVSAETWERAQLVLLSNRNLSTKNAKRQHLLRGLIRCGLCNHSYCGTASHVARGEKRYYRCVSSSHGPARYLVVGERCRSRAVPAEELEAQIWDDVSAFVREPGPILNELAERMATHLDEVDRLRTEQTRLERALRDKDVQRERILDAYRVGVIDLSDVASQRQRIANQAAELRQQIAACVEQVEAVESARQRMATAEDLLLMLQTQLDRATSWELKRELIESLVKEIRVMTQPDRNVEVNVTYLFEPTATCTGTGSSPRPA